MKLKKILHIETVLGKRGSDLMKRVYAEYRAMLIWDEKIKSFAVKQPTTSLESDIMGLFKDENLLHHVGMVCRILRENVSNYYLPRDFSKVLSRLDRNVPLEYLPDNFWGYFEFAEGSLFDDTGEVWAAYVYIGKLKNYHSKRMDAGDDDKVISVSYVNKDKSVTKFAWPLENKKISDIVASADHADTCMTKEGLKMMGDIDSADASKRSNVIVACLNAVLYIASDDPELTLLRPEKSLNNKDKTKQLGLSECRNLCTLPVTLVNYSYKNMKHYKDSAWWNTFPRWQRCGVGNKSIKLVWVKAHEKKFN